MRRLLTNQTYRILRLVSIIDKEQNMLTQASVHLGTSILVVYYNSEQLIQLTHMLTEPKATPSSNDSNDSHYAHSPTTHHPPPEQEHPHNHSNSSRHPHNLPTPRGTVQPHLSTAPPRIQQPS
uniref:Uncharacterized protein n=1 Tax=Cacopsylla melanoneura TaxID=428564 RepID=A0A8D8XM92_9HEMI